jgi:hypothetical protein
MALVKESYETLVDYVKRAVADKNADLLTLAVKAPGVAVDLKALNIPVAFTDAYTCDLIARAISSMARRFYKPGDDFAFPLNVLIVELELVQAAGVDVETGGPPVLGWADATDPLTGESTWDYGWCALNCLRDVAPWVFRVRAYVGLAGILAQRAQAATPQESDAKAFAHLCRAFVALIAGTRTMPGWIAQTASNGRERQDFLGMVQNGLVERTRALLTTANGLAGNNTLSNGVRALALGAGRDLGELLKKLREIQEQAAFVGQKGIGVHL